MILSGAAIPAATAAAVALAAILPGRWPMLLLPTAVLLPAYLRDVRGGSLRIAARRSLLWAGVLSIATIVAVASFPDRMASRVFHGTGYRDEMFRWIESGVGKEGEIRQFLPDHALHLAILAAGALATGGVIALLLGAFLLNYMNFYVGSLIAASRDPLLATAIGWPPWSVARVIGFILVAVALSPFVFRRFRPGPEEMRESRKVLSAGLLLVVVDVILKFTLASTWRTLLNGALFG